MTVTSVTDYTNSTYDSTLTSETASTDLDRDDFLELLIAQLEWQDPLDPMDDTEMVSQLAEFSSLDQLTAMNESMTELSEQMATQIGLSAANYIGKEVEAYGSSMSKDGDSISTVTYTLGEDATAAYAHILNTDGDIVATIELDELSSGDHSFVWNGLDSDGNEADDGQYAIAFTAEDENGDSITVSAEVSGLVTSVYTEDGVVMLGLSDGRSVAMTNVGKIVDTSVTSSDEDTEE